MCGCAGTGGQAGAELGAQLLSCPPVVFNNISGIKLTTPKWNFGLTRLN